MGWDNYDPLNSKTISEPLQIVQAFAAGTPCFIQLGGRHFLKFCRELHRCLTVLLVREENSEHRALNMYVNDISSTPCNMMHSNIATDPMLASILT